MPDSDGLAFHVHVNPNGEKLENKKEERTAATHNRTGWKMERGKARKIKETSCGIICKMV